MWEVVGKHVANLDKTVAGEHMTESGPRGEHMLSSTQLSDGVAA